MCNRTSWNLLAEFRDIPEGDSVGAALREPLTVRAEAHGSAPTARDGLDGAAFRHAIQRDTISTISSELREKVEAAIKASHTATERPIDTTQLVGESADEPADESSLTIKYMASFYVKRNAKTKKFHDGVNGVSSIDVEFVEETKALTREARGLHRGT
jgi:hypothetical protein